MTAIVFQGLLPTVFLSFRCFSLPLFMPHIPVSPVPVDLFCWQQAMSRLMAAMRRQGVHPADAVVLLP
ncbi:hypothetical protein, partial [Armatimonas sp.]|uniref:hypothetical protein n=1 Tax=Armatimonas sp. TaxID=1872638 RepID=UPI003750E240